MRLGTIRNIFFEGYLIERMVLIRAEENAFMSVTLSTWNKGFDFIVACIKTLDL